MKIGFVAFAMIANVPSVAAAQQASETVLYEYDALGRLVAATHSGGSNDGVDTEIAFDAAGNRTNYVVTGAVTAARVGAVVVVPLNGFTIIPIDQ